ncbi:MAG: RNA methyltransferase, partial [Alphaproteobacteria bacterium]
MSADRPTHTPKDSHYATLRRAYRDAKPGAKAESGEKPRGERPSHPGKPGPDDRVRLYGLHTVAAALKNPKRKAFRLLATRNALVRLEVDEAALPCPLEIVEPRQLDVELGSDAVHQGVMLEAAPLKTKSLQDIGDSEIVLVLDQVTDPHNVGAIMRSAVAFDAGAVITTERHSPTESGVLAKSASGALEMIPYVQITNLADALEELKILGFQTIGLDSEGPAPLEGTFAGGKIALVLGAEGKGLRQKPRATCDALARLDMPGA